MRRILHKDLGLTPYKVQLVQKLKPIDHPMRFRFLSGPAIELQKMPILAKKKLSFHLKYGMTPYKVLFVQELKPIDEPMRFRFVKWACDRLTEDAGFGKKHHLFS